MQGRRQGEEGHRRSARGWREEEGAREEKLPREASCSSTGVADAAGLLRVLMGLSCADSAFRGEMASLPLGVPTTHLRLRWALTQRLEEQRQLRSQKSAAGGGSALPDTGYRAG